MRTHRSTWSRAASLGLCLLALPLAGANAQDELPEVLPFASIVGDGAVSSVECDGQPAACFALSYDADFRLHPESDGIQRGDDLRILTSLAYPVMTGQFDLIGLPINRLVVRLAVKGDCFRLRGRKRLYVGTDGAEIAECVEAAVEISSSAGDLSLERDLVEILRTVSVELKPVGRRGRWKLRSVAAFSNPGFPFPVVGYEYDAAGRLVAGVTVGVGDDAGLSPFRTVAFRTLAP